MTQIGAGGDGFTAVADVLPRGNDGGDYGREVDGLLLHFGNSDIFGICILKAQGADNGAKHSDGVATFG